jgi:hypothetical protein
VSGFDRIFLYAGVMDNMIPVQSTSVNVSADDISALADFVLVVLSVPLVMCSE